MAPRISTLWPAEGAMVDRSDFDDELQVWGQRKAAAPGQREFKAACLKKGPRAFKSVSVWKSGDPLTGGVSKTELRLAQYKRLEDGSFDFDNPSVKVRLVDEEIERLAAFLGDPDIAAGRYRLVEEGSPLAELTGVLNAEGATAEELAQLLETAGSADRLADALKATTCGVTAAEMTVVAARRAKVAELQAFCALAETTETDMQRAIGDNHWLFGGSYAGMLDRRNLTFLDQLDIPLVCSDGTVHVVELKGPAIGNLVVEHRNHLIVGKPVHEATGQAMNYLRSLDEQGAVVERALSDIGISLGTRRVFATVVVGHPDHVQGRTEAEIEETFRTYNSHLSRVQVVTYKNLLDAAARALDFGERAG